ncbi:MAG: LytR C-terminal domain-containing protein [Lachnospiraceae bacterium]|nr:LytR C-terminal domain-containing protein [Lachnospiraceae bacterium]
MSKGSAVGIAVRYFFKTMGVIVIFIVAGILSYYLTMLYYNETSRIERSTQYTHVIDVNAGNESSNLIYSYNKDTKEIEAMVLELFDVTTKNLDYITIPANTQISISGKTYEELLEVSQQIPQLATMSEINTYFSGDVAYEYGIKILQEELKADIGYFTALSSEQFDQYFEKKSKNEPVYQPSKALLAQTAKCTSKREMSNFIEDKWDSLISDITLSQKKNYSEALSQVKTEYIRYHGAYGTKSGDVFILNRRKNRKLINRIWESEAYTISQAVVDGSLNKSTEKNESSVNRKIWITNASNINGLAAAWQEKLTTAGFQVAGVGTFAGEIQKKTKVYVKKKKWGRDLLKYFKNASIEKADNLTNGADIEIILGTQDDLS